jgi:hypothetical protein
MIVEAWKLSGDWRADNQGRWSKNSIVWLTPGLSPVAQGCFGQSNGLTNTLRCVRCVDVDTDVGIHTLMLSDYLSIQTLI